MMVTVFGATGAIGRLVVDELLRCGHSVTAYARDPGKVPAAWSGRVQVVLGSIEDRDQIDAAVRGAEAVISALGPSMDRGAVGVPLVEGTARIIEAMRRHGVQRYVGNGTPSVIDARDHVGLRLRTIGWIASTFLPRAYKEMVGMSREVMTSPLEWTIVRFTAPTNAKPRGRLHAGFYGRNRIGVRATRGDIAAFTAGQLTCTRYLRAAPAISN